MGDEKVVWTMKTIALSRTLPDILCQTSLLRCYGAVSSLKLERSKDKGNIKKTRGVHEGERRASRCSKQRAFALRVSSDTDFSAGEQNIRTKGGMVI